MPDHRYDQDATWLRLDPTLNVGLGAGWQASLSLPADYRSLELRSTLDGAPYQPPYADADTWSGQRLGLTDGRALIANYRSLGSRWILGAAAGSTLPLGSTETELVGPELDGLSTRPLLMGSGAFEPLILGQAILNGPRWGGYLSLDGRLPLYANGEGYRSGTSLGARLGPTWRVKPRLQLLGTLGFLHDGPATWDGEAVGGQQSALGEAALLYSASTHLVLQAQVQATLWQRSLGEIASPRQTGLATAGFSWSFGDGRE